MREKVELPAVKDSELEKILNDYGLCEPLKNEELDCVSCGQLLNWENIGALKVSGSNLLIFCNQPDCIDEAQSEQ